MSTQVLHLQGDSTMAKVLQLLPAFRQGDEHAGEQLVGMFAELLRQVQYDSLTGLLRLAATLTRLHQEVRRTQRYGTPLCVAMLDIDHFKQYNDTYGHVQGNTVLAGVAAIIRAEIRQSDLAGRFGGAEVCLVLPETPPDKACTVAERVRHRIAEAVFRTPEGVPFQITVSLGLAPWRANIQDVTTLLVGTDEALYRAKATRNCVVMAPERSAVARRLAHATPSGPGPGGKGTTLWRFRRSCISVVPAVSGTLWMCLPSKPGRFSYDFNTTGETIAGGGSRR